MASLSIETLLQLATAAEQHLETEVRDQYPHADKFTWFRACDKARIGTADHFDLDMAHNQRIRAAHDAYIRAIHAFYAARDGKHGFLGKYEVQS